MQKKRSKIIKKILGFGLLISICVIIATIIFEKDTPKMPDFTLPEGAEVSEVADGSRSEIYLQNGESSEKISSASANHREAFSRGDFVVWVEESQQKSEKYIVRYHIPSKTYLPITGNGTAQHPKVSTEGYVVWQEWANDQWQVYFFDGQRTRKITKYPNGAINPDISATTVVYATKNDRQQWVAVLLDLTNNSEKVIKIGAKSKHPFFYEQKVYFESQRK